MPDEISKKQIDGVKVFLLRRELFERGMDSEVADAAAKQHASRIVFDETGVDAFKFDELRDEILKGANERAHDRSQADGSWDAFRKGVQAEREATTAVPVLSGAARLRGERAGSAE